MNGMNIKKSVIIGSIVLLNISLTVFAVPLRWDNKVYGPVAENYVEKKEFSQKILVQNENSFFGESQDRIPIYSVAVNNKKNYIALTFDSSWNDQQTIPLLNILDKYHAKATFFLTAFYVWSHQDSVKEILRRGHEIGNHSNKHVKFSEHSEKRIIEEIEQCHAAVKEVTGIDMCLFRFPYGNYNNLSMRLLKERGYYPIQWTHDSLDWKNEGSEQIIYKLDSEDSYYAGNIILFHNGADYTVEALDTIFRIIQQKGLKCVKVSDLIYEKDFYVDMKGRQKPRNEAMEVISTSSNIKKK